jgi:hypothetical protein
MYDPTIGYMNERRRWLRAHMGKVMLVLSVGLRTCRKPLCVPREAWDDAVVEHAWEHDSHAHKDSGRRPRL